MNPFLLSILITLYFVSAAVVAIYTTSEYLANHELDSEGLSQHVISDYEMIQTTSDHMYFYCNMLVPFWNMFCAALILLVSIFDGFFNWLFDVMLNIEAAKLEREHLNSIQAPVDKWTTPI